MKKALLLLVLLALGAGVTVLVVLAQRPEVAELPGAVASASRPAEGNQYPPEWHVQEFGVTGGTPVNRGFVFFDGQYVDAPYTVRRKGLAIFINDRMIVRPIPWPWPGWPPPKGDVDPEMPAGVNKHTSQYDPAVTDYLRKKCAFIRKHYSGDERSDQLEEVIRALPFVKKATRKAHWRYILTVELWTGEVEHWSVRFFSTARDLPFDKDSVLKRLEARRNLLESELKQGDCTWFFPSGSHISFNESVAIRDLPAILRVLRSSKSPDAKLKELNDSGLLPVTRDSHRNVVTNFSASAQLDRRLEALRRGAPAPAF